MKTFIINFKIIGLQIRCGIRRGKRLLYCRKYFYVPKNARWEFLVEHSKETNIGEIIDDALTLIEKENNSLKNVLPKNYNSPTMRNVNLDGIVIK